MPRHYHCRSSATQNSSKSKASNCVPNTIGSGLFDGSFAEKTRTGIASGPVAKAALFPGDGTQRQNHGEWCWTIPQGARDDFEGFKAIALIEFNRSRFCVDHHRNASSLIGHLIQETSRDTAFACVVRAHSYRLSASWHASPCGRQ